MQISYFYEVDLNCLLVFLELKIGYLMWGRSLLKFGTIWSQGVQIDTMCRGCGIKNKDFAVVNNCDYHCKLYVDKINISNSCTSSKYFLTFDICNSKMQYLSTFVSVTAPVKRKTGYTLNWQSDLAKRLLKYNSI